MSSFIHLVILVIISILLSTYDVLGSPTKVRAKRMSHSQSDKHNAIKHEARVKTETGFCSGTIISDTHVLTAAHCVIAKGTSHKAIGLTYVTVAITKVGNELEFQTVRLVKTIYSPKDYFNSLHYNDDKLKNETGDIAVLELNYGLGLGVDSRIERLILPTKQYEMDDTSQNRAKYHIIFSGFGGTKAVFDPKKKDHVPGEFPTHLQYSLAEVLPSYSCPLVGNAQKKMCAKLVNSPGAGICGGDSGGALINLEKKTIIGVLSYGPKVCNQERPATYTRVFPYLSFIRNAMNDTADEDMRRLSFELDINYENALRANLYKYHWIWVPKLMRSPAMYSL